MVMPEKAEALLEDTKGGDDFKLHMGSDIKNLKQLAEALDIMAEDTFRHHVSGKKNDFASWIRHSIGDEELARSIEKLKSRKKIAEKVRRRVSFLERKRGQKVSCHKDFLTCGVTDFALGVVVGFIIGMIIAVVI
ncbi:MAG: DUF5752 family protein [Candidatus Woesearchaeota archaeon]